MANSVEDGKICDTDTTIEEVEQILLNEIQIQPATKSRIQEWRAKKIGEGHGYLSYIIRLDITWTDEVLGKLPESVILKKPTTDSLDALFESISDVGSDLNKQTNEEMNKHFIPILHANECASYEILSKVKLEHLPIPRIYHLQKIDKEHTGLIIMQDFSEIATMVNVSCSFRLEQVLFVAKALASLHAYSLQNKGWEEKLLPIQKELYESFMPMFDKGLDQLVEQKPQYFLAHLDKIRKFVTSDFAMGAINSYKKLNLPPVLVHGDFWNNNFLFKKDQTQLNGASDELLAIIDWQVAHPGSIMEDLAMLMVCSCSSALRRAETTSILHYYYSTLGGFFPACIPFSFETVVKAFNVMLPYSLTVTLPMMGMIAESSVAVDDPDREQKIDTVYKKARDALDDIVALNIELP